MALKSDQLPKITLITPSFMQGNFIRQTIESVLSQNYPHLEYIVVDGGSTDDTVSILQSYGKRVKWVSEKDKGQTHALQKGIEMSSGEIIGYLNSDDVLAPGALQTVAQAFASPNVQWVSGEYRIIDVAGKARENVILLYKRFQRVLIALAPFLAWIVFGVNNPLAQPSTFWRRSLLERVPGFRQELRYTMDYDLWLQFLQIAPPKVLPDTLSYFRVHGDSKGGSQFRKQFAEQWQVAKNHQTPSWVLFLQSLHNQLIIWVYRFIRNSRGE